MSPPEMPEQPNQHIPSPSPSAAAYRRTHQGEGYPATIIHQYIEEHGLPGPAGLSTLASLPSCPSRPCDQVSLTTPTTVQTTLPTTLPTTPVTLIAQTLAPKYAMEPHVFYRMITHLPPPHPAATRPASATVIRRTTTCSTTAFIAPANLAKFPSSAWHQMPSPLVVS